MNDQILNRFPIPFPICGQTVLVSPLHWGLGHASRSIELINYLLQQGASVVIAGGGSSGQLLRQSFPQLIFEPLPTAELCYSKRGMSVLKIIIQLPKFYRQTKAEKQTLQFLVNKYAINLIISDNRYGLYHSQIHSIIICHQIHPQLPRGLAFLQPITNRIHRSLLSRYTECWIPDYSTENDNLSGKLSHAPNIRAPKFKYIEPLSQFKKLAITQPQNTDFDLLLLLSGPEPQRSILESLLLDAVKETTYKIAIVRGTTKQTNKQTNKHYTIDLAQGELLEQLIQRSHVIICRSGYSSIMDIDRLQKKAILIPTPQQTEQEYLAKHISTKKSITVISQDNINKTLVPLLQRMLESL